MLLYELVEHINPARQVDILITENLWYAPKPSSADSTPHFKLVSSFQAIPGSEHFRSGFDYTAILPINGKATLVTISSNTTASMIQIIVNENLVYRLKNKVE